MNQKSTNLEKKLRSYSALATGILAVAGAGTTQAQIQYTDVNPDRVLVTGDTMNIDINHDGMIDFLIQMRDVDPNFQTNLYPMDPATAQAMGTLVYYTNLGYADTLTANTSIGASSPHWQAGVSQWVIASVWGGTYYGKFGDGDMHYAGIYFNDAQGAKHYGWIRFNDVAQNGTTATVMDYAYEGTANSPILAGAGATGIIQADNGVRTNVFGFDKKIHVRINKAVEGSITVINALGEKVKTMDITNNNTIVDMTGFSTGMYIVNIEMGNTRISRKVVL